jgi:asparagine synthase (glutamine-hydrolysing)
MCGICGQFNFKENLPVDRRQLEKMTTTLAHRGPDDEGYYLSGSLGLGFRRLAIIDLAGGHQPMSDPQRTVWVIFNGEIYNSPELKAELEKCGHVFQNRSDTEVIVHGYKQWGDGVLDRLNGMFGLAIWDENKKRLMLARDRMGIKLLYYKVESGTLYFGSELRAVLAVQKEKPQVDPMALNLFLRYRYTPSPLTLFQGIKKLAPGTRLIIENGLPRVERWWNFKPAPFDPMPDPQQAEEELLALYQRAVKRQLISDVPVGLLLSGGLDSGLLLALMNLYGKPWPTYTVGYGKSFADDELSDAAATAKILKAPNFSVKIDRREFEASLQKIILALEEPVASSSVVPMYHVSARARQEVKVALVGQGPDELFGGYKRHLGVRYGAYWRSLPKWVRAPIGAGLNALPRSESTKRGLYSLDVPQRLQRYQHIFSIVPGELVDDLFQPNILPNDAGDQILDCWRDLEPLMENTDELGGLQFWEIRSHWLAVDVCRQALHGPGLGCSSVFGSRNCRVCRATQRLLQSSQRRQKWLHRQVYGKFLPADIIQRKARLAVNVVDHWFRRPEAWSRPSLAKFVDVPIFIRSG